MNHPVTALSRRYALVNSLEKDRPAPESLGRDDLHLHVAITEKEFDIAHHLAHEAYVQAGYCDPTHDGRLTHYREFDALSATRVFLIRQGESWVGTVSFTCEGEAGLPIDKGFLGDIRAIQAEGRRVGVVWRLATLPEYRYATQVIHALLAACVRWYFESGLGCAVMMTHERHLRFYQRCFGMRLVRKVPGVSKFSRIPVVLIRCDRERIPSRWLGPAH